MARVNFIFALHFHQPTGQLKYINERIYENSYLMLLETFESFPDIKLTIHISGPLLLYLKEHHPDWLERMFKLGDLGSLEFMAGSIGEAILPLLPMEDKLLQLKKYLDIFEGLSGFRPRGAWLPERVWEPHLPSVLAKAGIEYVFVDDSTAIKTGMSKESTFYAWNIEDGGEVVKVFFIDAGIRYILPWESPDRVLNYIRGIGGDGSRVVLWGSDAEKFGEWMDPGRSRWWLNEFFEKLRRAKDDVRTVHPTEYLREHGVRGLIYLDTGSYDKMLEWSRGFFRNFLTKYAESNNIHKKMLYVRSKLLRVRDAPERLWLKYLLSQCNDAFWHGLFGGIYLAHLRQALYEGLIAVEREADELNGYFDNSGIKLGLWDFDYDGRDELLVETPTINLYVNPNDGGTLFEFDYKERGLEHNLQDTMTRYPEPYLNKPGFNPDWYRRVSWRVHVWGPETTLYDWINNSPFKDMSDLALRKFAVVRSEKPGEFALRAIGNVYAFGSVAGTLFVEKRVRIAERGHSVTYTFRNVGGGVIRGRIGIEYHVAWKINRDFEEPVAYSIDSSRFPATSPAALEGSRVSIKTSNFPEIVLEADKPMEIWVSQLSSYSRTEKGFLELPQGLGVMFTKLVELRPGDSFTSTITWGVSG